MPIIIELSPNRVGSPSICWAYSCFPRTIFSRGLLVMSSLLSSFYNDHYALFGLFLTIFFILYHGGFLLIQRGQRASVRFRTWLAC